MKNMANHWPWEIAMADGEEMVAMSKGKAINTLHWVGDDLWNLES